MSIVLPQPLLAADENNQTLEASQSADSPDTSELDASEPGASEPGASEPDASKPDQENPDPAPNLEAEEGANDEAAVVPSESSISGRIWFDINNDGVMDTEEGGIADFSVGLYQDNSLIVSTVTSDDGSYIFSSLPTGEYKVGVGMQTIEGTDYLPPIKMLQTGADNMFDMSGEDSNEEMNLSFSDVVAVTDAQEVTDLHAGMRAVAQIESKSTEVDRGTGIIVKTESEFRFALADSRYKTIYLGADITMSSEFTNVVSRSAGLVIDGYAPNDPSQTRHKYTSWISDNSLRGSETNLTFRNIDVLIRNYFGIYQANQAFTVTLDNVSGTASQFFYGSGYGNLLVRNCALSLETVNYQNGEFAQEANSITFEGTVSLTKNADLDSLFYTCKTIHIADEADVTWNLERTAGDRQVFFDSLSLVVGQNAKFTVLSNHGFMYGGLSDFVLKEGADARFIYTGTGNTPYIFRTGTLTVNSNASFLLYVPTMGGGLAATTITLNNPEQFAVLNPNGRALSIFPTSLTATDIESIGYLYPGKISGVYDKHSYTYIGSETYYDKWWMQNQPFQISARAWQSTNPTGINTNYSRLNISGYPSVAYRPQNTISNNNFGLGTTGQIASGVVIKHFDPISDITITNTVAGAYGDRTKLFTFTAYLKDRLGRPVTTAPTYTVSSSAISGVPVPTQTTLAFDNSGKATFQLRHGQSITIKQVDSSQIVLEEAPESIYTTTITDSGGSGSSSNTTGVLILSGDRSLTFTNTRISVVPTGVSDESGAILLFTGIVAAVSIALYAASLLYRHKRRTLYE